MVRDTADSEYLLTRKTAEEYRSKGYEVLLEAPLDFMPGFRADLLVRKGDEARVIEVKSRRSLTADPKISKLARLVESMPGWTFELVLVGEPERVDSPEGAHSFESEGIQRRIDEAERALRAELPEAAFLLAWSASEAVIRELLTAQGETNRSITSPGYVLDQGIYHGVISKNDYNALTRMRKYRNAIVHGFGTDEFNGELVRELIATTRRIMATPNLHEGSNGLTAS